MEPSWEERAGFDELYNVPTSKYVPAWRMVRTAESGAAAGFLILLTGLAWWFFWFHHKTGLVEVEGRIIGRIEDYVRVGDFEDSSQRWQTVYYRKIQYRTANGEEVQFTEKRGWFLGDPMRVPESRRKVRVFYHPSNPERGFTSTESIDMSIFAGGFTAVLGALLLFTSLASRHEWSRKPPEEPIEIPRDERISDGD